MQKAELCVFPFALTVSPPTSPGTQQEWPAIHRHAPSMQCSQSCLQEQAPGLQPTVDACLSATIAAMLECLQCADCPRGPEPREFGGCSQLEASMSTKVAAPRRGLVLATVANRPALSALVLPCVGGLSQLDLFPAL